MVSHREFAYALMKYDSLLVSRSPRVVTWGVGFAVHPASSDHDALRLAGDVVNAGLAEHACAFLSDGERHTISRRREPIFC